MERQCVGLPGQARPLPAMRLPGDSGGSVHALQRRSVEPDCGTDRDSIRRRGDGARRDGTRRGGGERGAAGTPGASRVGAARARESPVSIPIIHRCTSAQGECRGKAGGRKKSCGKEFP